SAMKRERSTTHSTRSGIAAPMSSPLAGSGRPTVISPPIAWRRGSGFRSTPIRALSPSCTNGEDDRRQDERDAPAHDAHPQGRGSHPQQVSGAPGCWIGSVIVMAGVPSIMQAMLDEVAPKLKIGVRMLSETVRADVREGDIETQLGEIDKANPAVAIGSHPSFNPQHAPHTTGVPL